VSIEAVNVDIAVAAGTPAEKSRRCAIATQQILHNNLTLNAPNYRTQYGKDLGPTDPSRPQGGDPAVAHSGDAFTDPPSSLPTCAHKACPTTHRATHGCSRP